MVLIPVFNSWIYPAIHRVFPLTPLRKIGIGFFVTVPAFLLPAWIEYRIGLGECPSIAWQLLSYVFLTMAEIFISITCIEFSYTQAPRKMKSLIMACFFMSVSLGNIFTACVNYFIQNDDGSSKLSGPDYFLFFAGAMFLSAVVFIPVAMKYKEKLYVQEER